MAAPAGGQVTTGSGQITQSGTTTTIRQNSQTLGLDWSSFNVASNETVDFVQPGRSAVAVNRITSSNGSEILGHLNANGQVWLINPNGILFGGDAQVNVGGLVASTLAPAATEVAGATGFSGAGPGSVVNQGTISAAKGGYVALLGNSVSNQGVVSAQLGTVALGAGSAATLTFGGNKLLQIEVDKGTLNALAANKGLIAAPGGAVFMTAGAANSLLASSVNTSGVIRATSFENHDGTIVLSAGLPAGEVTVEGLIDVSSARGVGGEVTATGGSVTVGPNATVNASGASGGGAIRIGGGWEGGEGVAQAAAVKIADTATLDASATDRGSGGEIVVRSDVTDINSTARVGGTLLAAGGPQGGDGGRVETSGHWLDVTGIAVDTAAKSGTAGTWLLDPYNITIGSTGSSISSGGGTYTPTADSTITASSISTALQNGNNVTISTYNSGGGSIGDITVASAITKASGNADVTLTLQAADTIAINAPISTTGGSGKLNVNLYADNDNGTHDGVGVVILNNSITTGGGSINFGTGATMNVNSVSTKVGGDVYVGGGSAINLTTAGGNVSINGALIIANTNGLSIDTTNGGNTAGNVLFGGAIDSGDTYALVNTNATWTAALAAAKSGVGSATGDTYLATITSRLENAVASYDVGYAQSWLGGARVFGLGTDAEWRWVAGPEGLTNNGNGLPFFTQNGCDTNNCSPSGSGFNGGSAINGAYINWNPGTPEPNNYGGTSLNQSGSGEWTLQFVGTQGQWNDLNPTGHVLPYTVETNLAPSPLTVNAGNTGTVTFTGAIGSNKPLASLTVTGQILGLPSNPNITTTGPVIFNGQVQINNVDYNVVVVSAPDVTTTYRSALPTFTPTYSGFIDGDTAASLTTPPTLTTTGSTNYVSTAPITASGAADATNPTRYYFVYDPGLLTVNPAPLTVTGTSVTTRAYNGLTNATLSGGALSGIFAADAGNVTLTQAGNFTSKNAAVGIPVTVTDTIGGSAAGDYTLVQPTNVTGTITPLAVTVSGSSVIAKTYDGTTAATLTGGVLNGVLSADHSSVSLATQTGSFASKDAGTGIAVTAADTLGGSAAADYTLTQPSGLTGSITPLALTVSGSTVTPKTYDGTTAATLTGGVLNGVLGADQPYVSLAAQSGSFNSKNAGTGIAVTAADTLSATGPAAGDYTLTQPTGLSGAITPLALTVTGSSVASKTYDGTTAATVTGGVLNGVVSADQAYVSLATQGGAFIAKDAGIGIPVTAADTLSAAGPAAGDYTLVQPTNISGTITPLALSVSGSSVTSKIYDGTTAATLTGGVLNGVIAADQPYVSLAAQFGTFASKNAGTGIAVTAADTLSATGPAAGDYTLTQPVALAGAITPKPITVTGAAALNKTYDGTTGLASNVTGYVDPTGFIANDVVSVTGGPVYSAPDAGSRALLRGTVALAGVDAGNYSVSWVNGSGTIIPAALTVTANADARFIGLTDTAGYNGASYSGFVDGQNSGVLGGALSISRSNAGVGAAGTYSGVLIPSGLSSNNYAINFVPGNYTIIPADELLVRTSNVSTTYGSAPDYAITSVQYMNGNNVLLTLSPTSVNGSTYTYSDGVGGTATFTLGATGAVASGSGNLVAGSYAIGDASFSSTGANFTGSPVIVGELTVNPLGITASAASPPSKTYDGTTSMSGTRIALSGVLSGDAVTGSGIGTFAAKDAGTGLSYSLNGLTLTGADAQDYYLSNGVSAVGNNGSITPLALTVSGSAVTPKTYDGTTTATITGGVLNGVLSADQAYVSLATQSGNFSSKNAGTGIAVTAADTLTVSGPAAGDYTLTEPTGVTGTIIPRVLTVSGSAVDPKTYDGTTNATLTGGMLNGVLTADRADVSLMQSGSFETKNAGTGIGVTATDKLVTIGAAAGDYTLAEPVGLTGTISPKSVTVGSNETAQSKTYDGTTVATLSGGPLVGVEAGDTGGLSLTGTFASPNAGQHVAVAVALRGTDAGNYVLGGGPSLAANIDPAPLVATANPVVTPLGGVPPAVSGTFSGFVDGQTLASLEAAGYRASWYSTVSDASAAGHYPISGSFNDGNYSVVQAAGNATAFDATLAVSSITNASGSVLSTVASLSGASGVMATGLSTVGSGPFLGTGAGSAGSSGTGAESSGPSGGLAETGAESSGSNPGLSGASGAVSGTGTAPGSDSSGMSASTGNGAGLSLGANSTHTASDGTVTLTAAATGGASLGGDSSASGAGTNESVGNTASAAKNESVRDFGGRRLIVVSGGVNSTFAR